VLGLPEQTRACLFDLDGVLTDTASVHKRAWAAMFDAYLRARAERTGEEFVPFDPGADYLKYVDGKKREDGVRSFLASRGIELPEGEPGDGPDAETVFGLGNRKNEMFVRTMREDGVKVFEGVAPLPRGRRRHRPRRRGGLVQCEHPRRARNHRPRQVRAAPG